MPMLMPTKFSKPEAKVCLLECREFNKFISGLQSAAFPYFDVISPKPNQFLILKARILPLVWGEYIGDKKCRIIRNNVRKISVLPPLHSLLGVLPCSQIQTSTRLSCAFLNEETDVSNVVSHSSFLSVLTDVIKVLSQCCMNNSDEDELSGSSVEFENEIFSLHPFCWCEKEDCDWCRLDNPEPNFHYKPVDLKVWWYKHIGRGVEYNKRLSREGVVEMVQSCINSISVGLK